MHVVITGANRGIGLALAKLYIARGDVVTATARDPASADIKGAKILPLDLNSDASINAFAAAVSDIPIDLLINNAGILQSDSIPTISSETLATHFRVNAIAPLLVSQALIPKLKTGSKLILMTSRMGSIDDNGSGGYYSYRASKAALNAIGKSLSLDLKKDGIAVGIVHPGMVSTGMTGFRGDDVDETARKLVALIDGLNMDKSGQFLHRDGQVLPW